MDSILDITKNDVKRADATRQKHLLMYIFKINYLVLNAASLEIQLHSSLDESL